MKNRHGARFWKVPVINRPKKTGFPVAEFTFEIEVSIGLLIIR